MKIYISVDMEGVGGIVHPRQESQDTLRFRQNLNEHVQWVIEGIQESELNDSITDITVSDSHGKGWNLDYDLTSLDERMHLITGTPRRDYMMSGIDESYDLVFFVGYHAGVGANKAVMCHSYNGRAIHNVEVNGHYMNEASINAAYAGYYNVPIGLAIGDDALGKQLIDDGMMPWIEYVATKEALSFMSGKSKSKIVVRREIISAVKAALSSGYEDRYKCYTLEAPYNLKVRFNMLSFYDACSFIPGVKPAGSRTLEINLDDYKDVFNTIILMSNIAGRAYPFDA